LRVYVALPLKFQNRTVLSLAQVAKVPGGKQQPAPLQPLDPVPRAVAVRCALVQGPPPRSPVPALLLAHGSRAMSHTGPQ
jgi:hypothetical protein